MLRRLVVLVLFLLVACTDGARSGPTRSECEAAVRHIVEVRVRGSAAPGTTEADLAQHSAALASAAGPTLVDRCESVFDRDQLDCVLRATSGPAVDDCAPDVSQDGAL